MNNFKELELTDKGFVKPGIYLSERGSLIIFYPSVGSIQRQFFYDVEWKDQILSTDFIKLLNKVFYYERISDL